MRKNRGFGLTPFEFKKDIESQIIYSIHNCICAKADEIETDKLLEPEERQNPSPSQFINTKLSSDEIESIVKKHTKLLLEDLGVKL